MHQQDSTTTSSLPPNSFVWFWCGFLKIGLTPYHPFDFRISHEISHPAIVFQFDLETSVETDRWRLLPRRSWFSRTVHFPSHTRRRREVPAEDTLIAMENDEKMMIDQWKPKESNGIQCDLGWFEELPLFSETSMMDHLNGERWSIGQVPVESQKMSDTVMHFLNWRCFRRSRFQIFFATPNSYYHHGYHHFLHTFPYIFGSPGKKQKRLLRVAPTARYSVVDLEVYCTCCTPDVSLFLYFSYCFLSYPMYLVPLKVSYTWMNPPWSWKTSKATAQLSIVSAWEFGPHSSRGEPIEWKCGLKPLGFEGSQNVMFKEDE